MSSIDRVIEHVEHRIAYMKEWPAIYAKAIVELEDLLTKLHALKGAEGTTP